MYKIQKPQAGEYPPYAIMYIDLLPDDGNLLTHLADNLLKVRDTMRPLSESKLITACAIGEWTIKEILVHVIDDERIYAYRALRFARGDINELPGFDQEDYIMPSRANERSIESIMDEYAAVRQATITLFANLPDDSFMRSGIANGHPMSVRAIAFHLAGHELHHLNSIRENYLP